MEDPLLRYEASEKVHYARLIGAYTRTAKIAEKGNKVFTMQIWYDTIIPLLKI